MSVNDELGKRMKENYECRARAYLTRRTPVIIRIDGKCFHSFTRGFRKPFDDILIASMQDTMLDLCRNIQGCVFGYCQSDEISLLLSDFQNLNNDAFFDYEIQKVTSITASMATAYFNKNFTARVEAWMNHCWGDWLNDYDEDYAEALDRSLKNNAMFDSRCFNIPIEEVANYFYWRQLDATRNSIQMVGQSFFSHKQLQNKTCNNIQDMLMKEYKINWNEYPIYKKRGTSCYRNEEGKWQVDICMPILTGENRNHIERHILMKEE